jgi:hypothetical protein
VPAGWEPRPKPWQRRPGAERYAPPGRNPYAARIPAEMQSHLAAPKTVDPSIGTG